MARTKYIVHQTNIMDDDGNKALEGSIVELEPATAKHYNKLGYLRPYIEDDDDDDEPEKPEPVEPVRRTVTRHPAGGGTGGV